MINILTGVFLISLGSFLEIYWYVRRFTQDGIPPWLSIITGVSLTLMLNAAVKERYRGWTWVVIVSIAIYSIFATSAGQAFELSEEINTNASKRIIAEYQLDEIHDIETDIEQIDYQIQDISEKLAEVDSLHDRGLYRKTVTDAEIRIEELKQQKSALRQRLSELRGSASAHDSVEKDDPNIYIFYSDMTGIDRKWLQFFLQTFLSAVIASMAPLGIIMMQQVKIPSKQHKPKPKKIDKIPISFAKDWIRTRWIGVRSGKSKNILGEDGYRQFVLSRQNGVYDENVSRYLFTACQRSQIIGSDGRIIEKSEDKALTLLMSTGIIEA